MKAIRFLIIFVLFGISLNVSAQLTKEQIQERREFAKYSKAELNEKASKDARKEAKELKKEGWRVAPGALPMEKQLDRSYQMKSAFEDDMLTPKYVMGDATSIGENYDAAKMQALALAKQNLAGSIQTEVGALIENGVSNEQLAPEDASSVTNTISSGKQRIIQSLGRTVTVVEMYRTLRNKNKEVRVVIAYNMDMAKAAAKKAIRADLNEKSEELKKQLDNLLGW